MTKILHILSQIPAKTGSGVFFENIINEFQKFGYEQEAVIGLPIELADYSNPGLARVHPVLFETPALPFPIPGMSDVMPYLSSRFSDLSFAQYNLYKKSFENRIQSAISKSHPDYILTHHLWIATAITCDIISRHELLQKSPKIFTVCHGTDLRQLSLAPQYRGFVTEQCRKVDGVFCLYDGQAIEISDSYLMNPHKITTIGNGFNTALFNSENKIKIHENEKINIIYAGKLSFSKGVKELIIAFNELPKNHFKLLLAGSGSGDESDVIFKMIENSDSDIEVLGMVSQLELSNLFKSSDIMVLPSFYEGLPLVILEALATGLKVVVNDLRGLKDWLPSEIRESGNLLFVDMPALSGIDRISEQDSENYISNLKSGIIEMSNKIEKGRPVSISYYDVLMKYSWFNIFHVIEETLMAEAIL